MMYILIILLPFFFFQSCQSPTPPKTKPSLASKFPELAVPIHTFELNQNEITLSGTTDGINIFVPKNSVVYEDGSQVKERIEIQFRAFTNQTDMLLSGLSTTSNGEILVSGGMFEVKASVPSGKQLKIIQPWRIEVPQKNEHTFSQAQVFKGVIEKGNLNWTNPQVRDMKIIPIPFDVLQKSFNPIERPLFSNILPHLDLPVYQNSWLATREFYLTRFMLVWYYMRFLKNENYYASEYVCATENHALSIFMPHALELDMSEADSFILERAKLELEKMITNNFFIDYNDQGKQHNSTSEIYFPIKKQLTSFVDSVYFEFKKEKHFQYTSIDKRFLIDVDSVYLRKLMKSYSDSIEVIKKEYQKLNFGRNSIACEIPSFGWYNVDYFYKQKDISPSNITLKTSEPTQSVMIVLEKEQVIIELKSKDGQFFELLNRKFPNTSAYVIATGCNDKDQVLYGYQKVNLGQDLDLFLEIKTCEIKDYKKILHTVLN